MRNSFDAPITYISAYNHNQNTRPVMDAEIDNVVRLFCMDYGCAGIARHIVANPESVKNVLRKIKEKEPEKYKDMLQKRRTHKTDRLHGLPPVKLELMLKLFDKGRSVKYLCNIFNLTFVELINELEKARKSKQFSG